MMERVLKILSTSLFVFFFFVGKPLQAQNEIKPKTKEGQLVDSAEKYLFVDQVKSIAFGQQAITLATKNKNYLALVSALNLVGNAHHVQGAYDKAYDYYQQALKIALTYHVDRGEISSYVNLGYVHADQENYPMARKNYKLGIQKAIEVKDSANLSNLYNNLASVFANEHQSDSALHYHFASLKIRQKLGRKDRIATSLSNIGAIYYSKKDYQRSKEYHLQALSIDSVNTPPLVYLNLSSSYLYEGNDNKALFYAKKALATGEANIEKYLLLDLYIDLYQIYSKKKNYELSLEYAGKALQLKDSISGAETKRIVSEAAEKYESEKKELKIQNLNKEQERKDAELQKQSVQKIAFAVGFVFLLVFFVFLYRSYRQKQKANLEILHQKHLVEEKQKEIIDSINYAKGIQSAILAKEEEIKKYFPESFLLYQPKDIVAGDFYFFETTSTQVFYAAADCTGHGVPGALVSVICSNALTRCVKEFGLTDPGKILDKTRELVVDTFKKSGGEVKDGMDISLISIKHESSNVRTFELSNGQTIKLEWAGANNPLWYIQSGQMKEITANKQPIGWVENPLPFTTHTITLSRGDVFFLFTDGYADQFGGPKGKKFKYSSFQQLLQEIFSQNMQEQGQLLAQKMEDWKGDLEQVDDVCVIGVKV